MRVFVAMSGGVDSSVAAALLVEAGHDVTGVTMQLLPEGDDAGQCCGLDAVRSAKRVCDALEIPHYTLNFRDVFHECVIKPFISAYAEGKTPNPCIECNDRVKFSDLLTRVTTQGADALATGHYARISRDADGLPLVERGADDTKDQSYFLYRLQRPAIDRVLFPLGHMLKSEVRVKAAALGLPTASRVDSQETCFVPGQGVGSFVESFAPGAMAPGPILDAIGRRIGTHRGIGNYTLGQRKGLGVPSAEPLYVNRIDPDANCLVVGPKEDMLRREVKLTNTLWRLAADSVNVEAQTRYRAQPVRAVARVTGSGITVVFEEPVPVVAPGQAVVCYQGNRIVAGGVAECEN